MRPSIYRTLIQGVKIYLTVLKGLSTGLYAYRRYGLKGQLGQVKATEITHLGIYINVPIATDYGISEVSLA